MNENDQHVLAAHLDQALPAVVSLPIVAGPVLAPVVWIEDGGRQDIRDVQVRLHAVGTHFNRFSEFDLRRIYGQVEVRWIYAFGRHANAFFLWMKMHMPSVERPCVTLPTVQAEYAVRFNIDDHATQTLLRSIVVNRTMFIHFDAVPPWVQEMLPLQTDRRRNRDYGRRGRDLIRSSLPLEFRPEVIARMGAQLEEWLTRSSLPE